MFFVLGPIASMFWLDDELGSDIYLDGIVTLVDAKNCFRNIFESRGNEKVTEFMKQIALADLILLNKIDLVDKETLQKCKETISSINSASNILATCKSQVDLNNILDLHAYDGGYSIQNLSKSKNISAISKPEHNLNISTITFEFDGVLDEKLLDACLEELLWSNEKQKIYRLKGVVNLDTNSQSSCQIQAVYDTFDKYCMGTMEERNRIIVIGECINDIDIKKKFWSSVKSER